MSDEEIIKYDDNIISDTDNKLVIASKSKLSLAEAIQKADTNIRMITLENRLKIGENLIIGTISNISFNFHYNYINGDYYFGYYSPEKRDDLTNRFLSHIFKNNNHITHDRKDYYPVFSLGDKDLNLYYFSQRDINFVDSIKSNALRNENVVLSNELIRELYLPLMVPLAKSYEVIKKI